MLDEYKAEIGEEDWAEIDKEDQIELIRDKGQGYNTYIFEKNQTLKDICRNDKSFNIDFDNLFKNTCIDACQAMSNSIKKKS